MFEYKGNLDRLVESGMLSSWEVVTVNEDGEEGIKGKFRNTERMRLTFPNGEVLKLDTFCSGSSEDTCFASF